jgi:hypothetical protein
MNWIDESFAKTLVVLPDQVQSESADPDCLIGRGLLIRIRQFCTSYQQCGGVGSPETRKRTREVAGTAFIPSLLRVVQRKRYTLFAVFLFGPMPSLVSLHRQALPATERQRKTMRER